jgi:hypothetical protein
MPDLVLHGGARGMDAIAADWAASKTILTEAHPADWIAHGRRAGPLRNQRMADRLRELGGGVCLALPLVGATNAGTWDMVRRAGQAGVRVHVLPVERRER